MLANTIDRKEIADILCVHITRISNIALYSNAEMPEPISEKRRQKLYDRSEIMKWISTDPLKARVIRYPKIDQEPEKTINCLAFLFGYAGANKRLNCYRKKRSMLRETKTLHTVPRSAESLNYF